MAFDNVLHFAKSQVTGGGGDALDGIDVTDPSFVVGSVCRVYETSPTRSVKFYVAEDSGAVADGDTVVMPAGGYSGNIRWVLYRPSEIEVTSSEPNEADMKDGILYLVVEQ